MSLSVEIFHVLLLCLVLGLNVARADEKLVICGTGDSQELCQNLAAEFMGSHPGVNIEVPEAIGSSGGIKATAAGKCDLGRVARPLRDNELRYGLHYKAYALSPVVLAVNGGVSHPDNLSGKELVQIYQGGINDWRQLGGPPGKIYVANREQGDSSRQVLEQMVPGFAAIKRPVGSIIYTTPELVQTLINHEQTIGYTSLAQVKRQPSIRVLKFEGYSPSEENISSGHYPLLATFGLVWRDSLKPLGHDFLTFLATSTARQLMSEYGVAPPDILP